MKKEKSKNKLVYWIIIIILALIGAYGITYLFIIKQELEKQKQLVERLRARNSELYSDVGENYSKLINFKNQQTRTLDSLKLTYKIDSIISCISHIELDSFILLIEKIDKNEFDDITENNKSLKYEHITGSDITEEKTNEAWRVNDSTFVYKLKSGHLATLSNINPKNGRLGFAKYKYRGYVEPIHSYLFKGHYYEAHNLVVFNDETSQRTDLDHHFVISPDESTLITYYWDDWAYQSGGFKLYEISDGHLNLVLNFYPNRVCDYGDDVFWCFSDIYFTNKDEIAFCLQLFIRHPYKTPSCYAKLKIERKSTSP